MWVVYLLKWSTSIYLYSLSSVVVLLKSPDMEGLPLLTKLFVQILLPFNCSLYFLKCRNELFSRRETERMTSFWSGLTEYHYLLRYKLIYMITARCKGQPITSGGRLHRLTAIFSYVSICRYTLLAEDVKCFNGQFQFICVGYASTSSVPLLKFFHDSSLIISLIQSRIGSWLGCQEKFPFPQLSLITSDSKCF